VIAFLDHTALCALYEGGAGQRQVLEAACQECVFAIAVISKVIFATRLDDLLAAGTPVEVVEAMGRGFMEDEASFVKISTDAVLAEAMVLAIRHHLKAEQSIQLATVLYMQDQIFKETQLDHTVVFVTQDSSLARAAQFEGVLLGSI